MAHARVLQRTYWTVGAIALVLIVAETARANHYPTRPVTIIAPAPPGAVTDFVARTVADALGRKWEKSVIVENRPGGGTLIGAEVAAKATPDGHTLLAMTNTPLVEATLHKTMSFDPLKDLWPVAFVASVPFVLVVNPALPVTSVRELIAYARAKPGELSYGTAGVGTLHHLSGEILQDLTGTKMTAVPYGGSAPAMMDVVSGNISLMFVEIGTALPLIKSGKLRALGITTTERVSIAPEIPTIAESGIPGFAAVSWQAIMVTGGTPDEIVTKLNRDINESLAASTIHDKMSSLGMVPKEPQNTAQLKVFMKSEFERWAKVLNDLGLARTL